MDTFSLIAISQAATRLRVRDLAPAKGDLDDVAFAPLVLTKKELHPLFSTGDGRYVRAVTPRVSQATCACSRDRSVSTRRRGKLGIRRRVNASVKSRDPVSINGFVSGALPCLATCNGRAEKLDRGVHSNASTKLCQRRFSVTGNPSG